MELTPTTELEAVNRILGSIGEARVNTLVGSIPEDAAKARDRLAAYSRSLQAVGWLFNTDYGFILPQDVDGLVNTPPNALKVVFTTDAGLVVRGLRVYDASNHTYTIGKDVAVNLTVFLPFNELPETARAYICMAAAKSFQDDEMGDASVHNIKDEDTKKAWRDFLEWDAEQARYSFANNNMVRKIKQRRPVR